MKKKPPRNTDKELLKRAGAGPDVPEQEPDITDMARATANAMPASEHRAWFISRGLPVPEEYLEGYDPLDKYDEMESYVEDKEFNPVRIISPKNAKYSD